MTDFPRVCRAVPRDFTKVKLSTFLPIFTSHTTLVSCLRIFVAYVGLKVTGQSLIKVKWYGVVQVLYF